MSLPVPLSVRLKTSRRDIHVTNDVDDLSFGTVSPGGFAECTLTLRRPINFTPQELQQFGRLYIYDARNGYTVYEGRIQDPGRTAGDAGQVYEVAAVGGMAHLTDDTKQYYLADTDMTRWDQVDKETAGGLIEQVGDLNNTGIPGMFLRIPQGTAVNPTDPSRVVAGHRGFAAAGQKIARITYNYDCGLTSANLTHSMYAATEGVGTADIAFSTTFSTVSSIVTRVITTDWVTSRNRPLIRFHYTAGAANVSSDTWWLLISGLNVLSTRYNKAGTELTAASNYTLDTVLASQVVEDVLGRYLTQTVDTANAVVDLTSFAIEQLAYPDGVTAQKIFEDLILLEQAFTYHLWESNEDTGKFTFEWKAWPVIVRYEADVVDGFSAPASGTSIFNQAAVRWHNRGTIRVSRYSAAVTALSDAGFDRTAFIDLGDEASTAANANRVGNQYMTEHRFPVNAGRLTVTAPIVDNITGRSTQPWEIRAGSLIRVRGIESYPDSLNSDGRDGLTIFKIAATTYSASDNSATLDLDSYSPSVARAIADLRNQRRGRKR